MENVCYIVASDDNPEKEWRVSTWDKIYRKYGQVEWKSFPKKGMVMCHMASGAKLLFRYYGG